MIHCLLDTHLLYAGSFISVLLVMCQASWICLIAFAFTHTIKSNHGNPPWRGHSPTISLFPFLMTQSHDTVLTVSVTRAETVCWLHSEEARAELCGAWRSGGARVWGTAARYLSSTCNCSECCRHFVHSVVHKCKCFPPCCLISVSVLQPFLRSARVYSGKSYVLFSDHTTQSENCVSGKHGNVVTVTTVYCVVYYWQTVDLCPDLCILYTFENGFGGTLSL